MVSDNNYGNSAEHQLLESILKDFKAGLISPIFILGLVLGMTGGFLGSGWTLLIGSLIAVSRFVRPLGISLAYLAHGFLTEG